MDRVQVYRGQEPFETDVLQMQQFAYEAMGLAFTDIMGSSTLVAGFACAPTLPASLNVLLGPGRIYNKAVMDNSPLGQFAGVGGLAADTNTDHQIVKQGLFRDTTQYAIAPPVTGGQSQAYLLQAQFSEADDATANTVFWVAGTPPTSTNIPVSPARRNKCIVQLKAGTAAATGSQVAPSADAGWTPLWVITVANGQTTITAGNIATAPAAPFLSSLQVLGLSAGTAALIWAGVDNTKFVTAAALKAAQAYQTLTDASTIAWDMNAGFNAQVTMTANRTIGTPTNVQPGGAFTLALGQDATGSRLAAWASPFFDWGTIGPPTLSTGANKVDYAFGMPDPTAAKAKMTFWKSA